MVYQPTLPSPKRWAAADIDFVREQHPHRSAQQIADELNEPVDRVLRLVEYLKSGGHKPGAKSQRTSHAVQSVSEGVTSAARGAGGTCVGSVPSSALAALFRDAPDLAAFVRNKSLREVATALKVSRTTAHRLSKGYWPGDARALMAAWDAYRGRSADQQSRWFLRRVQAGGVVHHAGRSWGAQPLLAYAGQTLAVARSKGGLLVHTLELPAQRFELVPVVEIVA